MYVAVCVGKGGNEIYFLILMLVGPHKVPTSTSEESIPLVLCTLKENRPSTDWKRSLHLPKS